MKGLTLDAGALIAIERNDRRMGTLLAKIRSGEYLCVVPAGALAQVWRNGRRQLLLTRFLASDRVKCEVLDDETARQAGQLCGRTGTADIVDASVVLCARKYDFRIVTSDPSDLHRLDPHLRLVIV